MKKFASLCLLFIALFLVLFLVSSPLIDLSTLNQWVFPHQAVIGSPQVQAAFADEIDTLGGQTNDPLRVDVMNNGSLAISTWQAVSPGSTVFDYEERYFDGFSWGSNLFMTVGADQAHLYSDYYQDLPYVRDDYAFSLSTDIGLGVQTVSGDSIITTWSLLDGRCQLRQTITYLPGSTSVSKKFEITNLSVQNEALMDLRFMHGGDVYFGRESSCVFDTATQAITVRNLDTTIGGLMALIPGQDNPFDSWFAGWIVDLFDETATGTLPGIVVANDEDIGVQMQWNRDTLSAGETWTITLTERFAEETSDETGETTESGATTSETTESSVTTSETTESSATTSETTESSATTSETTESSATTSETASATTTSESVEPESTTSESIEPEMTTTESVEPEVTTTDAVDPTSIHETSESQNATSESSAVTTTTSSGDHSVPATGEGGSCQIIAGGMMLMIVALYCWFKRLHGCH